MDHIIYLKKINKPSDQKNKFQRKCCLLLCEVMFYYHDIITPTTHTHTIHTLKYTNFIKKQRYEEVKKN